MDPSKGIVLHNVVCTSNFGGGVDEEWFQGIHIVIEAQAVPAIAAILRYQSNGVLTASIFDTIAASLKAMAATFLAMKERCHPFIFFHRLRLYMMSTESIGGVKYHDGQVRSLHGETGAQSCIVPLFDNFLGVEHPHDQMRAFLREMLEYVPPEHKECVLSCKSVRDAVLKEPDLLPSYNKALQRLQQFRALHFKFVFEYIKQQSLAEQLQSKEIQDEEFLEKETDWDSIGEGKGTGGSDFMMYLRKHYLTTQQHVIKK